MAVLSKTWPEAHLHLPNIPLTLQPVFIYIFIYDKCTLFLFMLPNK